jgi:nucleotide-binding universal stress UspA family protein
VTLAKGGSAVDKPVLFCYDGSDGSKTALTAAVEVINPADAVVLVVWMPAAVQLARAGSFVVAVPNEGEVDAEEATIARQIAEEGAAGLRGRGYNASARIAQANESIAKTIDEIAEEIDARLVVCGQRGRGPIGSALLGSVSHALAGHTKRPVLIAPQHPS